MIQTAGELRLHGYSNPYTHTWTIKVAITISFILFICISDFRIQEILTILLDHAYVRLGATHVTLNESDASESIT